MRADALVNQALGRAIYGQHEAGWLAFYAFFERACGLKICEKLGGLQRVARAAGWWWPFRGGVVLTERPTKLARDERGRLHCEDGPAVLYSDGWGVWAIHGVRLPRKIIEKPEEITIEEIRAETNTEIKRIARERFGEARYLKAINAEVIEIDSVAVERHRDAPEIVRALMQDDEGRRFLVGSDGSTNRTYYMEVDARVASCREAHSFLCGFDESRIVAQS